MICSSSSQSLKHAGRPQDQNWRRVRAVLLTDRHVFLAAWCVFSGVGTGCGTLDVCGTQEWDPCLWLCRECSQRWPEKLTSRFWPFCVCFKKNKPKKQNIKNITQLIPDPHTKRHYIISVYVRSVFLKYGSGKCVSSTFLASRGTSTSMNALDVEVNSRLWHGPQTGWKKWVQRCFF